MSARTRRFPGLQRQLAHAVLGFIRHGADPADKMIRSLLECEHDFINCDHPDFIGGRGAIRAVMQERSVRAANRAKVRRCVVITIIVVIITITIIVAWCARPVS